MAILGACECSGHLFFGFFFFFKWAGMGPDTHGRKSS